MYILYTASLPLCSVSIPNVSSSDVCVVSLIRPEYLTIGNKQIVFYFRWPLLSVIQVLFLSSCTTVLCISSSSENNWGMQVFLFHVAHPLHITAWFLFVLLLFLLSQRTPPTCYRVYWISSWTSKLIASFGSLLAFPLSFEDTYVCILLLIDPPPTRL